VAHHQDHDDHSDQDLEQQRGPQGAERLADQAAAVVERHDGYLARTAVRELFARQPRRDLGDLLFHGPYRRQRVLAVPYDDHTADRFGTPLVQHAAPQGRATVDRGDDADGDRNVVADGNDARGDVLARLDETDTAHYVLDAVDLDGAGSHLAVGLADGPEDLCQSHTVVSQSIRIDIDLVLAYETADRRHFGHPLGGQ